MVTGKTPLKAFVVAGLLAGWTPQPAASSDGLLGMIFDSSVSKEKLVEIDPPTGGLTSVGSGIADCCFISSGVSAIDPSGDIFYFVGRLMSDMSGTNHIFGIDTKTGAIPTNPALPTGNNYNFIDFDPVQAKNDDVVIDFGPGIGIFVVPNNSPASAFQLHTLSPDTMVTGDLDGNGLDELIIDFGPGIGIFAVPNNSSASAFQLHTRSPEQ